MDKTQASWAKQAGVTPGKLALIGVLAVVLAAVLYVQFAPEEKPVAVRPAAPRAATRAAAAASQRIANSQAAAPLPAERKKTLTVANWHSPQLDRVVAYDPFALPAAFPKPPTPEEAALAQSAAAASSEDAAAREAEIAAARAQAESDLEQLKRMGVKAIIERNDKWVAIVGDKTVRVGDEIHGFRVIAIEGNDVWVEKDLTR